jgi:hypothetical protein
MCPVSISVTTMVSKNCFNFGSMDLHQYCSSNCIGKSIKPTALSAYLKKFEETHRTVEVVRPGLVTHRDYPYIRASPDAIISCDCPPVLLIKLYW